MRREMGMIFQGAALFDSMSVRDNVQFPLDMFSSLNYADRVRRAEECLDRVILLLCTLFAVDIQLALAMLTYMPERYLHRRHELVHIVEKFHVAAHTRRSISKRVVLA